MIPAIIVPKPGKVTFIARRKFCNATETQRGHDHDVRLVNNPAVIKIEDTIPAPNGK